MSHLVMKKYFKILYLCLAGAFAVPLSAQNPESLLRQAARFEEVSDWISAASCYEHYLSDSVTGATEVCWRYANCLQRLYEYRQAEVMYLRVLGQDSLHYPEALFNLAMIKKNNAEYGEAALLFNRYLRSADVSGNRVGHVSRARMEVGACAWAQEAVRNPENCSLDRMPSKVNSPYSETSPLILGDSVLYFTSLQPVTHNSQTDFINGYYAARLYRAELSSEGVSRVRPLPSWLNHPRCHNSHLCFNADGTRLYLTRSDVSGPVASGSEIWTSELSDGKWKKPWRLGAPVNIPGTVSSQPCVVDANGTEVLYFVSDREGGFGGLDIWYAVREEDGSFLSAVNLGGTVNTAGNELTPHYDAKTGRLYFSSDGLPGLGGYDIYMLEGGLNAWKSSPQNLGYPLNSPANDIAFCCVPGGSQGYFASNRRSETALTDAVCCNDLYYFEKKRDSVIVPTDTVSRPQLVEGGTESSRKALSMLPLTLYFHNDEPDPKCESDTTCSDYHSTLALYLALRPKYLEAYSEGLQGADADSAREQIRRFFADSLEHGYRRLRAFFALLREDLESGSRVSLIVEGHASPLHSDQYNMHLSSRRIYSLWNSLLEYEGGFFVPYIASGQLRMERDPKGRRQAKPYVSDNPHDQRNSVYSVAAALERRIQIVGYVSEPGGNTPAANSGAHPSSGGIPQTGKGTPRGQVE